MNKYILNNDGNPVPESDWLIWIDWKKHAHRDLMIVGETKIGKCLRVVTVFTGKDEQPVPDEPSYKPLIWETRLEGCVDGEVWKYGSREDAEVGHKHFVNLMRKLVHEGKIELQRN
jgi:hypothetical protein